MTLVTFKFLFVHHECHCYKGIGADIADWTDQNVFSFGILEEQDTWWELCPEQKKYFEYTQHLNAYLREEYHSLSVSVLMSIDSNNDTS